MPDSGLIVAGMAVFFFGYFSRVTLRFFVRLVSGHVDDF